MEEKLQRQNRPSPVGRGVEADAQLAQHVWPERLWIAERQALQQVPIDSGVSAPAGRVEEESVCSEGETTSDASPQLQHAATTQRVPQLAPGGIAGPRVHELCGVGVGHSIDIGHPGRRGALRICRVCL